MVSYNLHIFLLDLGNLATTHLPSIVPFRAFLNVTIHFISIRRESVAEVVTIAYDPVTGVCLADLRTKLLKYSSRKFKIGAFSACSNVTGILTDVDR